MISVVIPTLNESATLPLLLEALATMPGEKEVLVVDGGSHDDTAAVARTAGATVLTAPRGRARQMNAGAAAARGDVLWFLHSDSLPAPDALSTIAALLRNPAVVGGCFRLRFDLPHPGLGLIAWGSHGRACYLRLIFGDQGLFVRRAAFAAVGGFPVLELMEDWALSRLLALQGRLVALPQPIVTSARRFTAGGIWSTFWLMQRIKLLYILGWSPAELRQLYDRERAKPRGR